MKTFETEKHDIPEGATHYYNEGACLCFAWFKDVGGVKYLWTPGGIECWQVMQHQDDFYSIGVKPIPTTEPKYRYEKVKTVFALERDLMHSGEYGELSNDLFYPAFNEVELVSALTKDRLYRRIEVTERELFIETYAWAVQDDISNIEDIAGMLFDSGKFKLVNGKG